MTRDSQGRAIFKKGSFYTPTSLFSPVWRPGVEAECIETKPGPLPGSDEPVEVDNLLGLFTLGNDTRWWHATSDFAEVKRR